MISLLEIFVSVDDFCKVFIPEWNKRLISSGEKKRCRESKLSVSEVITLLIIFHQSRFRDFKSFYIFYVQKQFRKEFPDLLSYNRFVEIVPKVFIPLCAYLQSRKQKSKGISFIDSTPVIVCHNKRIYGHKVFKHLGMLGKSTKGWFYGFKLHLVCDHNGEIINCMITAGNVDDRKYVPQLAKDLFGKMFADKGYISKTLFDKLLESGLQLVTGIKRNMKNKLLSLFDKIMLRKRALIESVNNQLKNVFQLEHSRHRSSVNGFVNMIAAVVAYTHHPNKASLGLSDQEIIMIRNLV